MRWSTLFTILLFLLSLTAIAAHSTPRSASGAAIANQSAPAIYFQDKFNGSSIDSTRWNSTDATSGARWCSSSVTNQVGAPGTWLDPSTTPCGGNNQNPPYGSVTVGGGSANFSSIASRTFPYIWNGAPSKSSPFPPNGNFTLELKLAYNSFAGPGVGFRAINWNDTNPVGDNPPQGQSSVFLIWGDISGLNVQLLGNVSYRINNALATHDYILEYVSGRYSVLVDGSLVLGPTASSVRPNSIWIGNPVFAWWQAAQNWTSFSLSLVQVTIPIPVVPPSIQVTPPTGPVGTKVLVRGVGITSSPVEVTFDDDFMGITGVTNSTFNFTLDVPQAQLGNHQIKTLDQFGTLLASTGFVVTPSGPASLGVTLTVGTIYFPADTVVASVLVTSNGTPLSSSGLHLQMNITKPDNSKIILNVTSIGNGLFRTSYPLPKTAQIGTYSIFVIATDQTATSGSALASFEVKLPWLSSQGSTLAVAGIASLATIGVALLSWRKGYFKRPMKDPF